ncbi:MAG: PilN domain-containing protein [Kiritimatiellae bacterium]|nr:PilN domain-containing protein [Kiritimatiellia bacterium]
MADDSITALALYPSRVEWTTLRRRKGQIEVAEHQEKALEAPAADAETRADYAKRLKPVLSAIQGRVAVALPTEKALLRVVKLPTTDTAEIAEMAALQVDKFSPFPVEQMAVGQEVLAQQESSAQVLIAATLQENVAHLGETLQAAGIFAREVDVAVMGWLRLLKKEGHVPDAGRHLLLIVEERGIELLVIQAGVVVVIRSLGTLSETAPGETATEIAEELGYTLTTLEAEWGAQAPGELQVWHRRGLPQEFLANLREQCEIPIKARLLDSLPPLSEGLARRAMERGPHMLDLAPASWKAALASRKLQRGLILAGAIFVTLWLLAVGALTVGLQMQKKKLATARAELAALQAPSREVGQLKEQVRALERYLDPTFSALECLREISVRIPEGLEITALTYKKYGQVALRGESDSSDPIYGFFQALEQTQLFPAVKPEGVTQQQRGGRARSQFKLTLELPAEAK